MARLILMALTLVIVFARFAKADDPAVEIDWERFIPLVDTFVADYPVDREFATVAIGISQSGERRYWQVGGPIVIDGEAVPSQNTIYQIGSITKTFTSLILADMVEEGLVSLDTTLGELAPDDLELSETTAGITLRELATHTSGLPRIPLDMMLVDAVIASGDPYAAYTAERMWSALETTSVAEREDRVYAYSNLGMGLLGQLLADSLETDYATLLQSRITDPLQMTDTAISLSESQQTRLAVGHTPAGSECAAWSFDALAGCGALYSTTSDLLTYLEAQMNLDENPLGPAMRLSQETHYDAQDGRLTLGLAWHKILVSGPHPIILHDGGTGGYVSFSGFIPETGTAVVILCNSGDALSNNHMVGTLGIHLLDASQADLVEADDTAATSPPVFEDPIEEN